MRPSRGGTRITADLVLLKLSGFDADSSQSYAKLVMLLVIFWWVGLKLKNERRGQKKTTGSMSTGKIRLPRFFPPGVFAMRGAEFWMQG
jgi:hypothetical protein